MPTSVPDINLKSRMHQLVTLIWLGMQLLIPPAWADEPQPKKINQGSNMAHDRFNIYCDPNGDTTGTCWTFNSNKELDCEYASQEFIRCSLPETKQEFNCLYYAPTQFACKEVIDPGATSINQPTIKTITPNSIDPKPKQVDTLNQNELGSPFKDVLDN